MGDFTGLGRPLLEGSISAYLLPETEQLVDLRKVEITSLLVIFNHLGVDQGLPLLMQYLPLGARRTLHSAVLVGFVLSIEIELHESPAALDNT